MSIACEKEFADQRGIRLPTARGVAKLADRARLGSLIEGPNKTLSIVSQIAYVEGE